MVPLERFSARFSLMLLEDFLDIVFLGDLSLMVTPIVESLDGSVLPPYAVPAWGDSTVSDQVLRSPTTSRHARADSRRLSSWHELTAATSNASGSSLTASLERPCRC